MIRIFEEGDPIYIIDRDMIGIIDSVIETSDGFNILAIETENSVMLTMDSDPLILNLKCLPVGVNENEYRLG